MHKVVSAIRAGTPEELRGALWKGFSGAVMLQTEADKKRTTSTYDMLSGPIDLKIEKSDSLLEQRLEALALHNATADPVKLPNANSFDSTSGSNISSPAPDQQDSEETWESAARIRVLVASTRYQSYSHPIAWKVICLLLAYMDEQSTFWVINRYGRPTISSLTY